MGFPGLSLLGFLPSVLATRYLLGRCAVADPSPQALEAVWTEAAARLGPPPPRAGRPEVRELPAGHQDYLRGVERSPRFAATVGGMPWSFRMVEIAPLLAFQLDIAAEPRGPAPGRALADLLRVCLPQTVAEAAAYVSVQGSSLLVYSNDPNLKVLQAGASGIDPRSRTQHGGVLYGLGSPLVLVARLGGRHYLRNGCHRLHHLAAAGVSAVPCLVVEAADYAQLGAPEGFDRSLLESGNPPTCGHYTTGRAYPVTLRQMRRVIQVSWSEYTVSEPDWP